MLAIIIYPHRIFGVIAKFTLSHASEFTRQIARWNGDGIRDAVNVAASDDVT